MWRNYTPSIPPCQGIFWVFWGSAFEDGRNGSIVEDKGRITATVNGSSKYKVKLWDEDGALEYDCSCPVGQNGDFCKHCVAVGFSWLEGESGRAIKACRYLKQPFIISPKIVTELFRLDKIDFAKARMSIEKMKIMGRYSPDIIA